MGRSLLPSSLLSLTLALTACGTLPDFPGPLPSSYEPASWSAPSPTGTEVAALSPDGFATAERMAVRVRNVGCGEISTGSGFALDSRTLVTNRHVAQGSAQLQLSTYDGRDVTVAGAGMAPVADLALVRTEEDLPATARLADVDPRTGDTISVVGYPLGGQLRVTTGQVVGAVADPLDANLGQVLVTDAPVEHGSSGSAVLDAQGNLVGVVYAKNARNEGLIVPVSTLRALLDEPDSFSETPGCS